ncbi:MAG: cytochrome c oxidase subunit I [Armatimonadetes bacterium]|nr:cytochrome c oxidase subunit I [Armatimonadota bacterium]
MATATYTGTEKPNYLNWKTTVASWLLTYDHKRIAILYLVSISIFFLLGGLAAAFIRLDLATPKGDLLTSDIYNKMFTTHGVIMIFLFLIPSIPAVFGNFLLPLMIGARDVAFPRLNLLSWYFFMAGALLVLIALFRGGIDTGWTFYTPYSSSFAKGEVSLAIVGVFLAGFASIFTGINFLVTIHKMRAPGMTWFRLPLFVWAMYATSLIQVLGTPVVAITLLLVAVERTFRIGIFDPNLGGDPILYQHLFWFYSHPAVYIMILPAMGVISEVLSAFSKRRVFGYHFVAFSSLAIAIIGFLVWGHHMFSTGQSMYAGIVFSFLTWIVAIPSAIKIFNWMATIWKGRVHWDTPMLYALGFMGLFVIGGLTGLHLAAMATNVHLTDTYFIVAHFHYVMVGGAIMGYLAALHFWWPKMTGRMYPEGWGKLAAMLVFVGFNLTFFPQFILGYMGMPRRYHSYPEEWAVLNVLSTAGSSVLGFGYLLPVIYLTWSLKYGKVVTERNPWGARGLEWELVDPVPDPHNFERIPIVTRPAYDYAHPEEPTGFVPKPRPVVVGGKDG